MSLVLDSSMSLTWCLPRQGGVVSDRVLRLCHNEQILVPDIWNIEMANILGLKRRDGNLSESDLHHALSLMARLPITTSSAVNSVSIAANLERIARFKIAAYDAIYVELALVTRSQLATFDQAMVRAARKAGIQVITDS